MYSTVHHHHGVVNFVVSAPWPMEKAMVPPNMDVPQNSEKKAPRQDFESRSAK